MRRAFVLTGIAFLVLLNFSCANLKSSLSKSDSSDYSKQQPYSSSSVQRDTTTVIKSATSYTTGKADQSDVKYKKDYLKTTGESDLRSGTDSRNLNNSTAEANQQLLNQYAEMDKLGDLVLYELDIVERRRDVLLEKFRNASAAERETLTNELNTLDTNQIALYKAYVKVYKEGKTNWPMVHKSVEATLLSLRGIGNK
ncbi:hypothetical protein [Dyadobacter frigoris]|uniref:Uncharacterized protein n=1 Tax=Dyadobacter frigoris TaxID=2576211 RepID=A0A4U6CUU2_9BACT|nr:hypothetical protein [Dyadobacter frigoris]TKT88480.1 hypothetical protein FDK13_26350 [Dyadobacter frigoris]GLU54521.1 hypothetical protein Dfri01_39820 [Dyadobacter frigoris]